VRRALVITDSAILTAETEYAAAVARAHVDLGRSVTVAAPGGSALASTVAAFAEVEALPAADPASSPSDFVEDTRFLAGVVARGAFDVVHSCRSSAHLAAVLAVGSRAPLVHLRGGAAPPRASALNRYLYRRCTAGVLASSSRVAGWVVEGLRVPSGRVSVVHAPVDVDRFRPRGRDSRLLEELGVPSNALSIVNVARLAPVKGQRVLVEAFARVRVRFPSAVLVLVGEPWSGEPEGILSRAAELGATAAVVTTGRRDDVERFLASASVCVSASVGSEENSRAVSEYMAAARPVVATRVGVIPELLGDDRGLVVEPGDADALAAALEVVLAGPDAAEEMGARARRFAEREFSGEAFARKLADALAAAGRAST
jgi:glycosyltransferase involved in cell wall biosynthesis